jgi:hypothetical protein
VDLIEEQDRLLSARLAAVGGALDHPAHLRASGLYRAQLLEGSARARGHDPRERRLARSGRAVEHHRVRMPLLDGRAQRRARTEEMRLTDELVQALRPHAHGQRTGFDARMRADGLALGVCGAWILAEEGIHTPEYRVCGVLCRCLYGRLGRMGCRTYDLDELVDEAKHQSS